MEEFTDIVELYLKYFLSNLLETVDETKIESYFSDSYNRKKIFVKDIENCLYEMNIPDITSSDKHDIVVLFDAIIKMIRNKIRNKLIVLKPIQRMELFYLIASFQAEFHGRINLASDRKTFDLPENHITEKKILQLAMAGKYNYEMRGISVIDKNAIQILFQEVIVLDDLYDTNECKVSETEVFLEVYGHALTIVELIGMRWLIYSESYENYKLVIENTKFIFKGDFKYETQDFVNRFELDVINYEKNFPENIITLLDNNFYKSYGFHTKKLEKIASKKLTWMNDTVLVNLSNYATIVGEIALTAECDLKEAQQIFNYLLMNNNNKINQSNSPEKDDNRIFEKCIVKVGDDKYLYSHVLAVFSYIILSRKLKFNLLEKCKGDNSKIIEKKIKNKFELDVKEAIENQGFKVLSNVHNLEKKRTLPNELDNVFVCDKVLYIIECKDVSFRYSPNGFCEDINKVKGFIKKMNTKIDSVRKNIDFFENEFSQPIISIEGIIIYRTANFVTENYKQIEGIRTISFEMFKNYIKRKKSDIFI